MRFQLSNIPIEKTEHRSKGANLFNAVLAHSKLFR